MKRTIIQSRKRQTKRLKFMNQGKYEKKRTGNEEENSEDSDKEAESSDNDYKFAFLQHNVTCTIQDKVAILKTWILLDSQSTVDVFSNPKLLTNIRDAKRSLTLYCNAGRQLLTRKGTSKDTGQYGSIRTELRTFCPWAMSRKSTG